jgi:hypothetical protein
MALLETEARTALLADTETTDHVGTRVYLGHAPQDTQRPYIVIACEQSTALYAHGASPLQTQGLAGVEELIDVGIYANEYGTARELEWHVRRILEGKPTSESTSPWLIDQWSMIGPSPETQSGADQRGWEVVLSFAVRRQAIWLPPS